jgi:hypothetical protein
MSRLYLQGILACDQQTHGRHPKKITIKNALAVPKDIGFASAKKSHGCNQRSLFWLALEVAKSRVTRSKAETSDAKEEALHLMQMNNPVYTPSARKDIICISKRQTPTQNTHKTH